MEFPFKCWSFCPLSPCLMLGSVCHEWICVWMAGEDSRLPVVSTFDAWHWLWVCVIGRAGRHQWEDEARPLMLETGCHEWICMRLAVAKSKLPIVLTFDAWYGCQECVWWAGDEGTSEKTDHALCLMPWGWLSYLRLIGRKWGHQWEDRPHPLSDSLRLVVIFTFDWQGMRAPVRKQTTPFVWLSYLRLIGREWGHQWENRPHPLSDALRLVVIFTLIGREGGHQWEDRPCPLFDALRLVVIFACDWQGRRPPVKRQAMIFNLSCQLFACLRPVVMSRIDLHVIGRGEGRVAPCFHVWCLALVVMSGCVCNWQGKRTPVRRWATHLSCWLFPCLMSGAVFHEWICFWLAGEKGTSEKTGHALHYKGAPFHRVVKDFMVQAGDFTKGTLVLCSYHNVRISSRTEDQ